MANAEKIKLFKMKMTADNKNLKDIIGLTVKPLNWEQSNYTDAEGEIHTVLAIELLMPDGKREFYRTEVKAFIEKFNIYDEVFRTEPDEEKPSIKITGKDSKRGNKYINFDIIEE